MNKKLLTLAVAAAMAVPAVASAEAILYGKVNVSLDWIDVDQNATFFRPGSSTSPSLSMSQVARHRYERDGEPWVLSAPSLTRITTSCR